MNIGFLYEKGIKGEFIFSPFVEMLASMHVITKPEHHLDRMKWMKSVSEVIPGELMERIRKFSSLTNEWLIVMDFPQLNTYSELDILDLLNELDHLSLYKWNKVFQQYNKKTDKDEKRFIIKTIKDYYELIFVNEIKFLQPFLTRYIKKEIEKYKEEGLLNRISKIHERIEVKETEIILHKNKEYHFDIKGINKIIITASTFLSPHLMLYEEKGIIGFTILVTVEEEKEQVPSDLINLLKALQDSTRLKILHEMSRDPVSTQKLAVKLKLTEAGISKHLKILYNAGLVEKKRRGNYIDYSLCKDAIDFIPYRLYEFIMR